MALLLRVDLSTSRMKRLKPDKSRRGWRRKRLEGERNSRLAGGSCGLPITAVGFFEKEAL
jgi:hypothetical protein